MFGINKYRKPTNYEGTPTFLVETKILGQPFLLECTYMWCYLQICITAGNPLIMDNEYLHRCRDVFMFWYK